MFSMIFKTHQYKDYMNKVVNGDQVFVGQLLYTSNILDDEV